MFNTPLWRTITGPQGDFIMKILWHSTAPWSPSSYSVLTARTVPGIVRDGHTVSVGTWYGLQGNPLPWTIPGKNGKDTTQVTVFPSGDGPNFSQDVIIGLYRYVQADALIVCSDVWPFKPNITSGTQFCPWLPVDMEPIPDPVLESLEPAIYPMCYSKWGTGLLNEAGVKAHYVPCSADGKMFKPGDKKIARETLALPEDTDFLVSVVGANKDPQDRKGLTAALAAFAQFIPDHPNAYLYLHTRWDGPIDITSLIARLGLQDRIIRPDPIGYKMGMLDTAYMVSVYQASDVLLNLAKSEGFGLPILEAQMCGTPVIATDFATTDELLWAGWKIPGSPDWAAGLNSWRLAPDIGKAVEALKEAYQNRDNKALATDARKGAMSLDTTWVHKKFWRPALADIEKMVFAKSPVLMGAA